MRSCSIGPERQTEAEAEAEAETEKEKETETETETETGRPTGNQLPHRALALGWAALGRLDALRRLRRGLRAAARAAARVRAAGGGQIHAEVAVRMEAVGDVGPVVILMAPPGRGGEGIAAE